MRSARSAVLSALIGLGSLGPVAATPGKADAFYFNWYGARNYPYYWNNAYRTGYYNAYNPYRYNYGLYNPGLYGAGYYGYNTGYYGNYLNRGYNPYYHWHRSYPYGLYY